MDELKIVKEFMDDREFRNYVHTMFYKNNFKYIRLDDSRVSDEYPENDNDIKVTKDGIKYTVQTYKNTRITDKQIEETLEDMKKEKLEHGIIVTNYNVSKETKDKAKKKKVYILDNEIFEQGVYDWE